MHYSRFKNNQSIALAAAAIAWACSLVYGWMPVLNGAGGGIIVPLLLTAGSALSIVWLRLSRSADRKLMEKLLTQCEEWRQGVVTTRITYIGGRERELQQLAWMLNDLMDQVETAQVDMRFSLAYVTWGDFTRKSYPQGLHGGFARALKELNLVTSMLSSLTTTVSDLMRALAEGDFSKKVDADFKGEYQQTVENAMQAMETMRTMLGDIGIVM
ncbi:MAG: methyl-accepting chemotaxis protein, partial [Methylobacter sp.]